VFSSQMIIIAVVHALVVPLLVIFRKPLFAYIGLSPRYTIYLISLLSLMSLSITVEYTMQAFGHMKSLAFMKVLDKLVIIAILLLQYVMTGGLTLYQVIHAYILSHVIQIIYGFSSIGPSHCFPLVLDFKTLVRMLSYSWPLIFSLTTGYVIDWMDLFFIRYFLNVEDVGYYQCAYQGMLTLSNFLMTINVILFPIMITLIMKKETIKIKFIFQRMLPAFIIGLTLIFVVIVIFSRTAFTLVFGHAFIQSSVVFNVLMICLGLQGIIVVCSPVLSALELTKKMAAINILFGVGNVVFDLILIPIMGMYGAAVATSIGYTIGAVGFMAVAEKQLSLSLRHILIMPLIFGGFVGLYNTVDNPVIRFMAFLCVFVFVIITIRKYDYFNEQDVDKLGNLNIPTHVHRCITQLSRIVRVLKT
ncbi:MAG: oligosaccharide flippase family protein, partial [Elusimicrobia bacterium]|nr:oligosaccharide flippase family protein [Elusimicrobiota bacterium]MBD3411480.1 oligosaccharide flippase family protein [Elusimicrobiota bacterium]